MDVNAAWADTLVDWDGTAPDGGHFTPTSGSIRALVAGLTRTLDQFTNAYFPWVTDVNDPFDWDELSTFSTFVTNVSSDAIGVWAYTHDYETASTVAAPPVILLVALGVLSLGETRRRFDSVTVTAE